MLRRLIASLVLICAASAIASCGGRSVVGSVPASPRDRLTIVLHGHPLEYAADATLTAARDRLFVRSPNRAAILDRTAIASITRYHGGAAETVTLANLPVEKPVVARPQTCSLQPLGNKRVAQSYCDDLPPDDVFGKMQLATGPGDIVPGMNHGSGCAGFFLIGTPWISLNFDIATGNGDPNGYCTQLATSRQSGPGGPYLSGLATDYRGSVSLETASLDMTLPGDKNSDRSYLLTYRGPGIWIDGAVGVVGHGQTSATYTYFTFGNSPAGSTMRVNIYNGNVAVLGKYLDFGGGAAPRLVP